MGTDKKVQQSVPGDGIRSLRSTMLFRAVNYELYVKPNIVIMALGAFAMIGCTSYILYMSNKYKNMGYYTAVESNGEEILKKKVSRWRD